SSHLLRTGASSHLPLLSPAPPTGQGRGAAEALSSVTPLLAGTGAMLTASRPRPAHSLVLASASQRAPSSRGRDVDLAPTRRLPVVAPNEYLSTFVLDQRSTNQYTASRTQATSSAAECAQVARGCDESAVGDRDDAAPAGGPATGQRRGADRPRALGRVAGCDAAGGWRQRRPR